MQTALINHSIARAPIRWAGSKRKLLPILRSYWKPTFERYVEAFAGSAALFFDIKPQAALLNDTNSELVHALEVLREFPSLLHHSLLELPVSSEIYYELRGSSVDSMDAFERAVRFFYLNRYCFNGIFRTNKKGHFNVPYAPNKSGGFPSLSQWTESSKMLRRANLSSNDFESFLLENVRAGDFVYLDPPYAVTNRRVFAQYSAQTFGLSDIHRLANVLKEIDARGAAFVVSYAQSPETAILSEGWNVQRKYAQRNVAGFSRHRRRAMEVLISNGRPISD